jgi:hypothetical protein
MQTTRSKGQAVFGQSVVIVIGAIYAVYFFAMTSDGLNSWFSNDDLMNLHYYWSRSWYALAKASVLFWTDYYRPTGGLFYRTIHSIWLFNPLPFRLGVLAILYCNLLLLYRVAARLASREAGLLAVLCMGVHGAMVSLYFDTGMVYDVLVFFFYFLTLEIYLAIRMNGRLPSRLQLLGLVTLYILALNAKEIAVSLPFAVLMYEVVWHPPAGWGKRDIFRWLSREGSFGVLASLVTGVAVIGKMYGADSLLKHPMYQPHISVDHYLSNYSVYIKLLSYESIDLSATGTAVLLIAMALCAAMLRDRRLIWATAFLLVAVMPIAFIQPRNLFAFYIPAAGWSLYAAVLAIRILDFMVKAVCRFVTPGKANAIGCTTGWLTTAGHAALLVGATLWLLPLHAKWMNFARPIIHGDQNRNRQYCAQIHELLPTLPPHAYLRFINDPYPADAYSLLFLVRLSYNDRTIQIDRPNVQPLATLPKAFNYTLDFVNNSFILRPD